VKRKLAHLETVSEVIRLRPGEKVVVWDEFASDSAKAVWMRRGDIGTVKDVDGSGDAFITFHGKESCGRCLSTIVKRSNWRNLRVETPDAAAAREKREREKEQSAKRRSHVSGGATPAAQAAAHNDAQASKASRETPEQAQAQNDDDAHLTEDQRRKKEAAAKWLKKEPQAGVVRYTFTLEGPLGLRFSKDVPPWILAVNDGSPAAKKAPRVPLAGMVIAVNGHEVTEEDCQEVMQGLKKRPVVLDIAWPVDGDLPSVNRA